MEREQSSRKGKHLTREERIVMERMSRGGRPPRDIAPVLGRHPRTIERELQRGRVKHVDYELRQSYVYSGDRGQDVHDLNATARGPGLKLGRNYSMAEFVRCRIVEHRESPDVVAARMRQAGMAGAVCTRTLYRYIEQGVIPGVGNESLWEKRKRARGLHQRSRRIIKRLARGASIEQRPAGAQTRQEFGHWEMDLLIGPARGSGAALLTMVERKHRHILIRKLPDKTQASVLKAFRGIESLFGVQRFRQVFKSITADNGSEFLDFQALEDSSRPSGPRTRMFYAHSYASWERGSNENANRMIRRFVAKDHDIAHLTRRTISTVESWINNYPRRILSFSTPSSLFNNELRATAS
jgi:transposase, IS30 family